MPLNNHEIQELDAAINAYGFPPIYFDFTGNVQVVAANMSAVELAIRNMLVSNNPDVVKQGLANVIYWGWAQNLGLQKARVTKFRNNLAVRGPEIAGFMMLVKGGARVPTLGEIRNLHMPEYSGISFISKILMFLSPNNYCVLDMQLAKLQPAMGRAINLLGFTTTISVTPTNEATYDAWRAECRYISTTYFNNRYRVVDIERGFFHLIQTNRLPLALQIYSHI